MPNASIDSTVAQLRQSANDRRAHPLPFRRRQLAALRALLEDNESILIEATQQDLGKPTQESLVAEVAFTLADLKLAQKKIDSWAQPRKVRAPYFLQPAKASIRPEPLGLCLIIGPWNYPVHLIVAPLIGALAAGNAVLIKPSEVAVHTSALLARLIPEYLDKQTVAVVEGGVDETTQLLNHRFDKILYTGNGTVGRIVMAAAAKHLTPVVLELGGKNPCYVDEHVALDVAAKRICWAKFFNAGQTCVAPDYLLVHRRKRDALVAAIRQTLHQFYGDDVRSSPDYGRIINARHHSRLVRLLSGGTVLLGGQHDEAQRYIEPTLLADVDLDSALMQDEIFGPLLPLIEVDGVDEAVAFTQARPKSLAAYVFTSRDAVAQRFAEQVSAGAIDINHGWLHMAAPGLPFGGVGESGMGAYHGPHSFAAFSHDKPVFERSPSLDLSFLYPPYGALARQLVKKLL